MQNKIQDILKDLEAVAGLSVVQIVAINDILRRHLVESAPVVPAPQPAAQVIIPTTPGKRVVAYIDGACSGNPGPGGWGVYFPATAETPGGSYNGFAEATTNNRMEILAAISALEVVPEGAAVELRSDSQLLIGTMTENWNRGKNTDLWIELDNLASKRICTWTKIKGHSKVPGADKDGNDRADFLARAAVEARGSSTQLLRAAS